MLKKSLMAMAIASVSVAGAVQAADQLPDSAEMWKVIQQQQQEIEALKNQLNHAETKIEATDTKVNATADVVERSVGGQLPKLAEWVEKTKVGGYGEHHFNHFEDKNDQVDAHRFVVFLSHQFNDDVRFFSEIELEHGLSGDDKPGEVELEQAYIEWDYTQGHNVQLGQFLIPVGIINETHEPDSFYGTERNLVEKNIIPATWWETGARFNGEIAPGLSYSVALHSGLKTTDGGKIRDGRQKSAEAVAEDLAYTARLKYTAMPGLELAASLQYQQDITQGAALEEADAWLTEIHAIYTIGPFTTRALWASWDVEGIGFETTGRDSQEGWYIEPSYKVTDKLGVFARYSEYNNNAGIGSSIEDEVWDYGLNYWLTNRVVLKADYSDYRGESSGSDNDAFNLGVGWSF